MLIRSIQDAAKFSPQRFTPVPLYQSAHSRTMVVGLEAGQAIPVHHPGSDITMLVLEGKATLVAGTEDLEQAGPGALLIAAAGEARGIRADVRTKVLVVVSPPPSEADHREIMQHFQHGTWR